MRFLYTRATRTMIEGQSPGGTYGSISFDRLADVLHHAGEIRQEERITHFTIDTVRCVIEYRTERR